MRYPTFFLTILLALHTNLAISHDHRHMQDMSAVEPLAGDSLHHLKLPLTDQLGKRFTLADEHRSATVITMFYGDCQIACPIAIENVKRTLQSLPEAQRGQVRALLISLNPGVNTPASLNKLAQMHQLLSTSFRLAVSDSDADTRQLAAALGVQYRRLPNGEINHSTRFIVMNARGVIVGSSERLGIDPDPQLLAALKEALR